MREKLRVIGILSLITAVMFLPSHPLSAQDSSRAVSTSVPFSGEAFVPCANGGVGEQVSFSATLHTVMQFIVEGNRTHLSTSTQLHSVQGIGLVSGQKYSGSSSFHQRIDSSENGAFSFSQGLTFRLITSGGGNNWQQQLTFHITVNANGDVTAEVAAGSAGCN